VRIFHGKRPITGSVYEFSHALRFVLQMDRNGKVMMKMMKDWCCHDKFQPIQKFVEHWEQVVSTRFSHDQQLSAAAIAILDPLTSVAGAIRPPLYLQQIWCRTQTLAILGPI